MNTIALPLALILYFSFVWLIALLAYLRDRRRPPEDPEKHHFKLGAVMLAPVVLPIFLALALPVALTLFVLRSLLFGVFLIVFPLTMLIPAPDRVKTKLEIAIRHNLASFGDLLLRLGDLLLDPMKAFAGN